MGVLSDFFVADSKTAQRFDADAESFPASDVVGWKGMTPVEVSMLGCIARNAEWGVQDLDAFECVLESDDGDRYIHRFPDELVRVLALADEEELNRLAKAWAAIEEIDCDVEAIRPLIDDLSRLAKNAQTSSRSVYFWTCV